MDKREAAFQLVTRIRKCDKCSARVEASRPVPGRGSLDACVLAIGRNPGRTEDEKGLPFIGPTKPIIEGQLQAAGLDLKHDVFFTNLIDCYTWDDRPPETHEIQTCWQWLRQWLYIIQPKLVLTYGSLTARFVLDVPRLEGYHGKVFIHKAGFVVIPCMHPGAQLYRNSQKLEIARDTAQIRRVVAELKRS